jgi:hypothetical protein
LEVETEATISQLREFKAAVEEWDRTSDPRRRAELRTFINENTMLIRREIGEAGCYKTVTISPPPAVGGLVMKDVDLFDVLFDPPYSLDVVPAITDMIDQTIGVLKVGGPKTKRRPARILEDVMERYAFVAMPMDPDDPDLEDVLDAIKEAGRRCGVHAERVDEPQYNERITDRILESVRRAEYVIVDLTHSKPNVFYEAGYAQGAGKTPIYIAREGSKLEFDLKDYPVIMFKNMTQLKERLEKRLRGLSEKAATKPKANNPA